MYLHIKILTILLCLFLTTSCLAQDLIFNVQFFDQSDGISDRSTYSVNQDDRGLIWIGTGNGLNQFDGQKFKVIGDQNSRTATGSVLHINKSKEGHFWIQKGDEPVFYFDPYKEKNIPIPYEEELGFLTLVSSIKGGENTWFRNKEGNVFYLDEDNEIVPFSDIIINPSLPIKGSSWGTLLIDDEQRRKKIELNKLGDTLRQFDDIPRFFFDKGERRISFFLGNKKAQGNLKYLNELFFEIKQEGGTYPINLKKNGKPFSFEDVGLSPSIFFQLTQDHDDNYWLIARNKIWFFDKNGDLQKELTEELLEHSSVTWNANDVLVDDNNRLWIATGLGLYLIEVKPNPFQLYLDESGKTSVRSITATSADEIIVANYHGTKKINIHTEEIIQEYKIYDLKMHGLGLSKGKNDMIWFGSHGNHLIGINEKDNSVIGKTVAKKSKINVTIPYFDWESDHLYLGTNNGLWISNADATVIEKYEQLNEYTSLAQSSIAHFYKNTEGIWIASKNGLYLLDQQEGIIGQVDFPHNDIKYIHEDKSGDFWLATQGGGLIHWNQRTNAKRQYTTKDGLSHNVIYTIYEDKTGYLWLPSNNGLMRFEKKSGEVIIFQPEDGIAHKEFNTFSHYQAEDGRLYFGGLSGITAFYPDKVEAKKNDAPFIVTQLQQFDAGQGKLVNKMEDFRKNKVITLAPDDKFFTIDFSLLDYAGQSHFYAWRINGLEEDWNYQSENSIRINGLQYGNFVLQIKGKGAGGQWAKQELTIPIYVRKPFYLEWPFIAFAIFIFGVMVFSYLRLRFLRLQRVQKELKKQVAERTHELSEKNVELASSNQIKDKLFAIIAHDLRGPVFSLQDVGRKLNYLIESEQTQRLKEYGDTVDESVYRLTNLLNNLLSWAHQNLKSLTLKPEVINVEKLIRYSVEEIKPLAAHKNIDLLVDVSKTLNTFSDEQALSTIIRNLLTNAIKFTPIDGKIELFAKQQDKFVLLSIKDNGIGIAANRIADIFDLRKNKSTRGTEGEAGTGLGLSVCKELAILNGGDITIESTLELGTIFIVKLPV